MSLIYLTSEAKLAIGRSSGDGQPHTHHGILLGVLALLVDARESRIQGDKDATKTEVVLARAGVSVEDIAAVMGKNRDAVRMAVNRGKAT